MAIIPTTPLSSSSFVTPEQKKQKRLMIILAVAVIATSVVLYFGFFRGPSAPESEVALPEIPGDDTVETLPAPTTPAMPTTPAITGEFAFVEKTKLDFSLFDDPRFKDLKELGTPLDISGEKGRRNPFVPY